MFVRIIVKIIEKNLICLYNKIMLFYFTLHMTLYDISITHFSFRELLFTNRLFIDSRKIKILFENYVSMIFLLLLKSLTLYLINYIAYQLIQLINQVKQSYDFITH